eukprot:2517275-Alexandrium_andersonii.AAC.1
MDSGPTRTVQETGWHLRTLGHLVSWSAWNIAHELVHARARPTPKNAHTGTCGVFRAVPPTSC